MTRPPAPDPLADHTDPRLTGAQAGKLAEFEAAAAAPESWGGCESRHPSRGTTCIEPAGHSGSHGDGTVSHWLSPNPCPVSVRWLDDTPDTACVLRRGHDGGHLYDAGLVS